MKIHAKDRTCIFKRPDEDSAALGYVNGALQAFDSVGDIEGGFVPVRVSDGRIGYLAVDTVSIVDKEPAPPSPIEALVRGGNRQPLTFDDTDERPRTIYDQFAAHYHANGERDKAAALDDRYQADDAPVKWSK